jgi:uncharacterized protein
MGTTIQPRIKKIEDTREGLRNFEAEMGTATTKEQNIFLQYPTVYIHNWEDSQDFEVYVGETNNILQRTKQHYDTESDTSKWENQLSKHEASMYVIAHDHFNKSLTLDVENRLIHYISSIEQVKKVYNNRDNPQNKYYPDDELDDIFHMIWKKLHRDNKELFPSESVIKSSAIFKASPFHKLTDNQLKIKNIIIDRVFEALKENKKGQIIFINGETGTGKTVLNSSTFYSIFESAEEQDMKLKCRMMVNHDEQITVYAQIADKMGLTEKYGEVVCKPTHFINSISPNEPIDVAFVDEAHLLLTRGKQSYRGQNQLKDILERARVTVVMFDENQILTAEQYWEAELLDKYKNLAISQNNYFELKDQLRMLASQETINWINSITFDRIIPRIPVDKTGYDIKIFDSPEEMEKAIKDKAAQEETHLSRLIATYDWKYIAQKRPTSHLNKYWEVIINAWHKPWNRELNYDLGNKAKRANKKLAWAEQPQTIDEVGSTFTIQGFDLNYAGVILGPSVTYEDGKIKWVPEKSYSAKATQKRTLSDGQSKSFGDKLLQHEVRVLMTRGVNGLYIYACNDKLREALKQAAARQEKK